MVIFAHLNKSVIFVIISPFSCVVNFFLSKVLFPMVYKHSTKPITFYFYHNPSCSGLLSLLSFISTLLKKVLYILGLFHCCRKIFYLCFSIKTTPCQSHNCQIQWAFSVHISPYSTAAFGTVVTGSF
jgi:hypothetical protein